MSPPSVPPEVFRAAMGRFATGVTVVTTVIDGEHHGMTANAVSSASLDPPLVLVCVDHHAVLHQLLGEAEGFGVSILAADQEQLSVWFSIPDRPSGSAQFADVAWTPGTRTGVPLLDGTVARLECRPAGQLPAGDHSIFLGEAVSAEFDAADPLLYLDGVYVRG